MRIIGFNGPPRSGKDTLATFVERANDMGYRLETGTDCIWGAPSLIQREALIMPCRLATFAFLGQPYSDEVYESEKDKGQAAFGGETIRQAMIAMMQDHFKPRYGKGFAGATLAAKLERSPTSIVMSDELLLVTDIGFQEEVDILAQLVGDDSFMLVKVLREGTSFKGDSRGWCSHDNEFAYVNDDTPMKGARTLMTFAHETLGWEF